jgi:hemolysin III
LEGLLWIAAGGLAYSAGVVFYLAKRIRYSHFVWHLFVAAGTACHFCAVLWHAG